MAAILYFISRLLGKKSEVFGENTADNILKGKIWNRVIRAHKLTLEALWRILWPLFTTWAEQNDKVVDGRLIQLAREMADGFNSEDNDAIESSLSEFLECLEQDTDITATARLANCI